jgi:hypothetical protein
MVKNTRQLSVMLVDNGSLVQELHYGPYSRFWWDFSTENNTVNFPIRLGQKVKVFLNGNDFFLRVIKGANNLPEYYCISDQVEAIEASPTKQFQQYTRTYSKILHDIQVMQLWAGTMKIF